LSSSFLDEKMLMPLRGGENPVVISTQETREKVPLSQSPAAAREESPVISIAKKQVQEEEVNCPSYNHY